jgi:arylsulfatase A-like enzyme
VKGPAAHIDVLPTLLEASGLPPAEGVDGLSLLPLLKGDVEELPPRTLFFQWHRGDAPELGRACAAVEARWKWLRPGAPDSPAMLFDLRADPGESRDLAGEFPDEANRLKAAYAKWFQDVSATRGYAPPRIRVGTPHENPTLLTRQDWRGTKAGWGKDNVGQWELEAVEGEYEVVARFRQAPAEWTLTWNGAALASGPGPLRVKLGGAGSISAGAVDYLELRKLP